MEADYFNLAWNVYIGCAVVIVFAQLFWLWVLPRKLVVFLMVLAAVIMCVPYTMHQEDVTWQAPALMVALIDAFVLRSGEWLNALSWLLQWVAAVSLIGFLVFVKTVFFPSKRGRSPAA
ncbi:MAG: hypothetical protein AAGF06_06655 [Pseudomonadota bacterium]